MSDEFERLADIVKEKSIGKKIIYIPNPGNYGDGLIRYATKKFLQDYHFKIEELNLGYSYLKLKLLPYLLNKQQYLFVLGGGGGWCKAYHCGLRIAKALELLGFSFIVLPSTYEMKHQFKHGITVARDKFESLENSSGIFCHDMAFYLVLNGYQSLLSYKDAEESIGYLMRTDKEKSMHVTNFEQAIDISTFGDHMSNIEGFLGEISKYTELHTDRLHVCIGGIYLGKKVYLHEGSYFKINRIYRSSIEGVYSNVLLHKEVQS